MEVDGVIKMILIFEMLKGNPTICDPYQVDRVAARILSGLAHVATSDPTINVIRVVESALQMEMIQL